MIADTEDTVGDDRKTRVDDSCALTVVEKDDAATKTEHRPIEKVVTTSESVSESKDNVAKEAPAGVAAAAGAIAGVAQATGAIAGAAAAAGATVPAPSTSTSTCQIPPDGGRCRRSANPLGGGHRRPCV